VVGWVRRSGEDIVGRVRAPFHTRVGHFRSEQLGNIVDDCRTLAADGAADIADVRRRWGVVHRLKQDLRGVGLREQRPPLLEIGGDGAAPVRTADQHRHLVAEVADDKGHDELHVHVRYGDTPRRRGDRGRDCRIGADQRLGEEGQGFINTLQVLDAGRIGIAALSVGLAQGAYEAALRYAKHRRQFGQPIAAFQAIQWKLADAATRIEASRLLTYRAAYLKDLGRRMTKESAMAKLYSSETAVRVADDCVQIHGGYGFVKDYPAEKYFRDVKLLTIGEGTSEIQRLVIARQLLAQ